MAQYINVQKKGSDILVYCSAGLLFLFFICGVLAPWIAPYDLEQMDLASRLTMPFTSFAHILGTDELGRDVFSRLVYSLRLSFLLAIAGTILGAIIGTTLGFFALHYFGLNHFGFLGHKRHGDCGHHGCLRLGPLRSTNSQFGTIGLHRGLC